MITHTNMTIHALNNLPEEYNNIVEMMEIDLTNTTNPLTLKCARERLQSKYARLKKSRVAKQENDKEMMLAAKAFSGRCYACGKFGHKGADCQEKEHRGQNRCGGRN